MLIRPDPRIDTTNISTARLVEKNAKPKALNYSQLLLRVKFLQASRVMRAGVGFGSGLAGGWFFAVSWFWRNLQQNLIPAYFVFVVKIQGFPLFGQW